MKQTRRGFLRVAGAAVLGTGGILEWPGRAYGQAKKDPIKIGILVERTGGLAAYGYSHEKVMVAAVAKANKEGGIAGRPVELFVVHRDSMAPEWAL